LDQRAAHVLAARRAITVDGATGGRLIVTA
jgi:hypothetical protein